MRKSSEIKSDFPIPCYFQIIQISDSKMCLNAIFTNFLNCAFRKFLIAQPECCPCSACRPRACSCCAPASESYRHTRSRTARTGIDSDRMSTRYACSGDPASSSAQNTHKSIRKEDF